MKNVKKHNVNIIHLLLVLLGFLSAQRITLDYLSVNVCLITLIISIFLFVKKKQNEAITVAILTLFFLTDNGGNAYLETNTIIRYLIYASVLIMLIRITIKTKIKKNYFYFYMLLICFVMLNSYYSFHKDMSFDSGIIRRDLIILFLLLLYFFENRQKTYINKSLLLFGLGGYVLSDLINVLFLDIHTEEYLNYDSTKSVILILPMIFLMYKNTHYFILSLILVCILLINYGTRMIILSSIVLSIFLLVVYIIKKRHKIYRVLPTISIILLLFFVFITNFYESISHLKAFAFLQQILEIGFNENIFKILDPIRYATIELFFSQNITSIMFGNGIGVGIVDENKLLSFVNPEQTAFSINELNTGVFFNFHDAYIDISIRFGFIAFLYYLYVHVIKHSLVNNYNKSFINGFLLINCTYSISGILITYLFLKYLNDE